MDLPYIMLSLMIFNYFTRILKGENIMSVLVGKEAPNFVAKAVMPDNQINENFELHKYLNGKIGVLFFWPLDFTFVCPSEIISFNNHLGEFSERGVKVIGVSVDSHFTHLAWKNVSENKGGVGDIKFPMVSDLTKSISRDYDVLIGESVALRGTFIIDQDLIIRHQLINDLPLGRNTQETIRMVDALLHYQEHGEVCPAGWNKGKEAMKPTAEGVADFLASHAERL
jgi:peroxiredoxin (alkyl hydroperoxide reductase subunit C)